MEYTIEDYKKDLKTLRSYKEKDELSKSLIMVLETMENLEHLIIRNSSLLLKEEHKTDTEQSEWVSIKEMEDRFYKKTNNEVKLQIFENGEWVEVSL